MKVSRRNAREVAVQVLFQYDLHPDCDPALIREFVAERLHFPKLEEFAMGLVHGVRENLAKIDAILVGAANNWSVGRMATVDRNILRLAVFELRLGDGAPAKVVINEALEICKKYSTVDAVPFINGVLDRVAGLRTQASEAPIELPPVGSAPEPPVILAAEPPVGEPS